MEQFYVIKGGIPLVGEVEIGGAKNAALAILAAAIMADETVTIENLPNVRDINVLLDAMREIGVKVDRLDAHTVKINGSMIQELCVEYEFIKKYVHLITCWGHCLENITMLKWRFLVAAISGAGRLTCI